MANSQSILKEALALEGITGELADLSYATAGQESGSNENIGTSNRGAKGMMQILPSTFKGVADADWDIKNPLHNARAGVRYLKQMYDQGGGSARMAAIGYYGGPAAMKDALAGKSRIDTKNPTAPNTFEYADQVLAKAGMRREPIIGGQGRTMLEELREWRKQPAPKVALTQEALPTPDALIAEHVSQPTLWDVTKAAFAGNTDARLFDAGDNLVNTILRDRPEDAYDPEFRVPQEAYDAATDRDTVHDLFGLKNQYQYEKYVADKAEEQGRLKVMFSRGTGTGVVAAFGAEILSVSTLATGGLASIRVAGAAAKAAAAGRSFNYVRAGVVENLASGTAIEGAIQLAEQRFDAQSLLISVAADTAVGGIGGAFAQRGFDAHQAVQRMATAKIEADAATLTKAQANLGTGHTQEELIKEFDRVRVEELKAPAVSAITPSKPAEKLLPHPDDADLSSLEGTYQLDTAGKLLVKEPTPSFDMPVTPVNATKMIDEAVPTQALHPTNKVTVVNESGMSPDLKLAVQTIKDMAHLLPAKVRVGVGKLADTADSPRGMVVSNANVARIGLSEKNVSGRAVESATHEVTHVINDFYFPNATPEQKAGILADYGKFVDSAFAGNTDAVLMRWADLGRSGLVKGDKLDPTSKYVMDLGEYMAEQGVRYFKSDAAGANTTGFAKAVVDKMIEWSKMIARVFVESKEKGYIPASKSFSSYMDDVVAGRIAPVATPERSVSYDKPTVTKKVNDFLTNPDAIRFNLTGLPIATKSDRADAEAMLGLRLKAEAWGKANPKNAAWDARSKNLSNNDTLNVASTALTMLSSKDDLSRMLAHMLLEDASGVAGKRPMNSAALSKDTFHKLFLGNTTNDLQNSFAAWSKPRGGSFKDDYIKGGQLRKKFDLEIAAEIEYRSIHKTGNTKDPIVDAAVRSVHAAYERMRNAQIEHKTLGWAALPKEEVSYMPHSLMPGKVNSLTPAQTDVLRSALTDQYVSISGWDVSFSDQLSAAVVARVKARAVGGFETPLGGSNPGSAQIIEDALGMMNLDADTIRSKMKDFRKGAANFTKHRTSLDLNKEYPTPDGVFKLMDVYETDQLTLLRSQAGRVSGEVALAQQGIYGKPHMALLRKTLAQDAKTPQEFKTLEAFDQIAAEFMHEPFGTVAHKNVERLRIMTSLLRLGGIVYSQFAEFINMAMHIGSGRTLSAISSVPRLRSEVIDLAAGKVVSNPLLSSMETFAGEFGTDAYKIVLPFDSMDHAYPTYGRDTLTMFDRLLRGGSHVQAKLSGWRALHAAQQRGVAEQIVAKMSKYVRDGKEDKALESMGIDSALAARIKVDIDKVGTFDSNGNLTAFDMTKFTDPEVATATWQAVKRGTSQIIQGTFIGETGKWAHNDYLKVLTQFRTFSITSMEKQWGRQRNSRGQWEAVGMVMAAMSLAVPIHVARTYANSVGRKDQDAYLEKNLKLERIVRASMNYVAGAGMFPDLFDMAVAAAPEGAIKKAAGFELSGVTGGRPGADTTLAGTFAPAVGTAESVWKLLQNMDDIDSWEKMAPGNRHPFVVPLLNALGD